MSQSKLDRIKIFANKLVQAKIKSFSSDARNLRENGPKILVNSIPKAGTHLMETTLNLVPGLVFSGNRAMLDWDECTASTMRKLRKIKKGQFANAHLPAHTRLLEEIEKQDIKVIFMIRDPRDVIVSHAKYVNEIDTTHPSHKVMALLPDEDARLMAVIQGVEGFSAAVDDLWGKYDAWFKHSSVCVVKFEELIGERGGGSEEDQLSTLDRVVKHIGLNLTEGEILDIAHNVFNPRSPTFRKGATGNWKKHFKEEHILEFNRRAGGLLGRIGYE